MGVHINPFTGKLDVVDSPSGDFSDLTLDLGTAASPSISFDGDPNTGIYSPGADQVAISTNGTGRLFVDASGKVGLGTSSPQSIFHIGANPPANAGVKAYTALANSYEGLLFDYYYNTSASNRRVFDVVALGAGAGGAIGGSDIRFLTVPASATGTPLEAMRIDSAQRVGVGTTSPSSLLHIESTSASFRLNGTSFAFSDYRIGGTNIGYTGDAGFLFSGSSANFGVRATNNLAFGIGASEKVRIDTSGRLLVGTSSSLGQNELLQIVKSDAGDHLGIFSYDATAGGQPAEINFSRSRSDTKGTGVALAAGDKMGALNFRGWDGDNYSLAASIIGEADGEFNTSGDTTDSPGRLVFSTTADGASSPTERMRINSDGEFVFNSATYGLRAQTGSAAGTTVQIFSGFYSASTPGTGTACIYIHSNGDVENANNSYGAISDIKLKENIVDANSQWSDIKALQVRNYNFKEGQTHTQLGLIAQEVELVSPGLVSESPDRDEDGNDLGTVTKSVNYSVLYMKAVKALQEAMERIETLEAKVAALETP